MAENATKNQKAKSDTEEVFITEDDFFRIAMSLEEKHALFYKVWELGVPRTTKEISTAAVRFDEKGLKIDFMFNPDLWKNNDDYNRAFIIAHEALHVALNHGSRMKGALKKKENMQVINMAADVVVNHTLINKFGFNRSKVKDADKLCWVDTVFGDKGAVGATKEWLKAQGAKISKELDKKEEVPVDDKSFEYYFRLLKSKSEALQDAADKGNVKMPGGQGQGQGQGQGSLLEGEGMPQTVDDHGPMTESGSSEEIVKELSDRLSGEEKNEIKDVVDKHYQHEAKEDDENGDEGKNPGGKFAGKGTGGSWTFIDPRLLKMVKKKKWETIIKKWAQKYLKNDFRDVEQWARKHRRTSLIESGSMFLPCEMEVEDMFEEEDKIEVFFFMDTSGSCASFKERFFKAAHSLPEEKFTLRAFVFDTSVKAIDLTKNQMFNGGGTSFSIIEQHIQQTMKKEKSKYPQAVFVLTDGYGDVVNPQTPEKWFWFLSDGVNSNNSYCIPKKSNTFDLKDFE